MPPLPPSQQPDGYERQSAMQRDMLLVATVGASLINGSSISPLFDPIFFLLRPFVAQILTSPLVLLYLTSFFISLLTLAIAGIPAALYERVRGHTDSTPLSIGIWFVCTAALTLPSVLAWLRQAPY